MSPILPRPRLRSAASRRLALGCAALMLAGGLSACGGIKHPSLIPHWGNSDPKKEQKLKGERIPVLALNDKLEPNTALAEAGFTIPAAQPLDSWPLPGGPPGAAVEHVVAAPDLQVAWTRRIGRPGGVLGHVTASPILADGRLYVMDSGAEVSALDPNTGREIWRVNLAPKKGPDREAYGGGLAFSGGQVFVSSGFRFMAALDAATGAVKWRKDTPAPLHGAPTVTAGRVFAVDTEDQLQSFAVGDGTPGWTFQALQEPARMLKASSPAVDGEVIVAPFASGELTALNALNGSELWSYVLSLTNRNNALSEIRDIAGRPVIDRGDVLAGSHSGVFAAIDLRTGQPRWSLPIATTTTPWPAGDAVYVASQAGEVICISREAGQVYWIADMNAVPVNKKGKPGKKPKRRPTWSGPVLASDHLIVVSDTGELRALDPKTGKLVKSLKLRSKVGSTLAPVPVDGRLYVLTDSADLIAIR